MAFLRMISGRENVTDEARSEAQPSCQLQLLVELLGKGKAGPAVRRIGVGSLVRMSSEPVRDENELIDSRRGSGFPGPFRSTEVHAGSFQQIAALVRTLWRLKDFADRAASDCVYFV